MDDFNHFDGNEEELRKSSHKDEGNIEKESNEMENQPPSSNGETIYDFLFDLNNLDTGKNEHGISDSDSWQITSNTMNMDELFGIAANLLNNKDKTSDNLFYFNPKEQEQSQQPEHYTDLDEMINSVTDILSQSHLFDTLQPFYMNGPSDDELTHIQNQLDTITQKLSTLTKDIAYIKKHIMADNE